MKKSLLEEWLVVDGRSRADQIHIAIDRFILLPVMTVVAYRFATGRSVLIVIGAIVLFLLFMAAKLVWLIWKRKKHQ
jgi:hypothetical protein